MDRNGAERTGMELNGLKWNRLEWTGQEWNGLERTIPKWNDQIDFKRMGMKQNRRNGVERKHRTGRTGPDTNRLKRTGQE